jgi:hypothetical protein
VEFAIADMMAVILPTAQQTAALRATLFRDEAGRSAWAAWQHRHGGPESLVRAERPGRLLPMLAEAASRNQIELQSDVRRILRTAQLWEQLRGERVGAICQNALEELKKRRIDFVVLKGIALANTDYPDAALRHCHDCDLLVRPDQRERAARALLASRFSLGYSERGSGSTVTVHESGLPISLHERLFRIPHYAAPVDEMWARAHTREVYGVKAQVFSPEDMLLHVCGHAACSTSREHLTWVCDSWMILARNTTLDWRLFSEMARRCNLELPLAVLTRYLAEEMGAPIPDTVLMHLQQESTTADAADREAALFGATAGSRGDLRGMVKSAKGWADRMILAKWLLFPAPRFIRWKYRIQSRWLTPVYYFWRPIRGGLRLVRESFSRSQP